MLSGMCQDMDRLLLVLRQNHVVESHMPRHIEQRALSIRRKGDHRIHACCIQGGGCAIGAALPMFLWPMHEPIDGHQTVTKLADLCEGQVWSQAG